MSMNFHRKLPIPQEVKKEFPLSERMVQIKAARDESIRSVFNGSLDKFIFPYLPQLRSGVFLIKFPLIVIPRSIGSSSLPSCVLNLLQSYDVQPCVSMIRSSSWWRLPFFGSK